jgi:hypothetical protein
MPWFYIPLFLGGGFFGLRILTAGFQVDVDDVFDAPYRYFAATSFAIRDSPSDLLLFGGFLGGSVALGGSAFEVPYEAFAGALPGALFFLRNTFTGRDLALAYLVRLGTIRTSLLLVAAGHRGRFWRQGEALWQVERLYSDLAWDDGLSPPDDEHASRRRQVVATLGRPLRTLATYSLSLAEKVETSEIAEIARDARTRQLQFPGFEPYASEWTLAAENTELLIRRIVAREERRRG